MSMQEQTALPCDSSPLLHAAHYVDCEPIANRSLHNSLEAKFVAELSQCPNPAIRKLAEPLAPTARDVFTRIHKMRMPREIVVTKKNGEQKR